MKLVHPQESAPVYDFDPDEPTEHQVTLTADATITFFCGACLRDPNYLTQQVRHSRDDLAAVPDTFLARMTMANGLVVAVDEVFQS